MCIRDRLDAELKEALEEKLSPWGIDIIDVEVRDIVVPKELQAAMAAEAVAERKKNARMVLAEVERDISEMLKDASEVYDGDQDALRLRTMHLAYESVEKSGGTLVIPSAFSEGFVDPSGAVGGAGAVSYTHLHGVHLLCEHVHPHRFGRRPACVADAPFSQLRIAAHVGHVRDYAVPGRQHRVPALHDLEEAGCGEEGGRSVAIRLAHCHSGAQRDRLDLRT